MFVGNQDLYATEESAEWAKNELGDAIYHFEIIKDVDHSSFNFGKDMSYMNGVIDLIKIKNPTETYTFIKSIVNEIVISINI